MAKRLAAMSRRVEIEFLLELGETLPKHRNLLDRSYRGFLSRYKGFADEPGRDLRMRVSTTL